MKGLRRKVNCVCALYQYATHQIRATSDDWPGLCTPSRRAIEDGVQNALMERQLRQKLKTGPEIL